MTIPINLFFWTVCMIPIALLLILLIFFQWGASRAAPVTLGITGLLSVTVFKANWAVLSVELLKASWSSVSIIVVIFTAILLYEIGVKATSFDVLNRLFTILAPNELIRIFMIGISFASFLQGITGFGVPVLIVAPLLLKMGVAPLYAVIIPLLGHSWAGTFGTLALGWQALLNQTGIVEESLIFQTTIYASLLLFILTSLFNLIIAFKYGKKRAIKKGFLALTVLSVVQGMGQLIFSLIRPELAVVLPSIFSLVALILLSKTALYREPWRISKSKIMVRLNDDCSLQTQTKPTISQSLLPYTLMTALSLLVLLFTPLRELLSSVEFGPSFNRTITGYNFINPAIASYAPLTPLTHVGVLLFVTCLVTYGYYRKIGLIEESCLGELFTKTIFKTLSPSIAIFSLLCLSRIMAGTGQTFIMAQGIAKVLKEKYVFIAPFIGLLGSFMTGSNLTSNILFSEFQLHVSEQIGLKTSFILGAQTAGGGIGTSIAPGNIILGTTTAGILGSEGRVLIKLIPYTLVAAAIFGVLLYVDFKWL
ncbi:MAG: L-lactate permease [Carnobacterium sp.]|uniref:L-lactate permease n=1 Tax=Carnobacterium sp. TaxID=48221 RepID=UPI003C7164B3